MYRIKAKLEVGWLKKMAGIAKIFEHHAKVLKYMEKVVNKGAAGEKEWWIIGSVYAKEAQWDKAGKAFLRALEIDRNNLLYMYWLAKAKAENGEDHTAEILYDEVLKRNGFFCEAIFAKGKIRLKQGDTQGALICFEKCWKMKPNDAENLNYMALCCLKTGDTNKAVNCLDKAIKISPRDTILLANYGTVCIKMKRYQEAIGIMEKLINKSCETGVLNSLGYCYSMMQDYERSIDYYRLALELEPQNQDVQLNLASVYAKVGKNIQALEILKRLVIKNPIDYQLLNNLAWVYESMQDYNAALCQYYRSLAVSMGEPEIAFNLISCLKKQHYYIEAMDIVEHLKKTSDWEQTSWSSLAQIYEALGADNKAVEYYNKAFGLEPC